MDVSAARRLANSLGLDMALRDTEVIRIDALVHESANPVNDHERRLMNLIDGSSEPSEAHEFRWLLVALEMVRERWAIRASLLHEELCDDLPGREPLTGGDEFPADDWSNEDIEAMRGRPSTTRLLIEAERELSRAKRRCDNYRTLHEAAPWYTEAMECTSVPETDGEVNDGVSRVAISLKAPLTPLPPAPPPVPPVVRPTFNADDIPC